MARRTDTMRGWLVALAVAGAALHAGDAPACAILPVEGAGAPRLSIERVLLLYDDDHQVEHFVREVSFDGASSTFAFVVPTPSKPEVAEVTPPPFEAIASTFPLEPPPQEPSGGLFVGASKSAAPAPVEVLSTQRVGKFTAFVLAAGDPVALQKWLTDNRIGVPAGGQAWLQHYVDLRFFFTAFRYEAPPPRTEHGAAGETTVHLGDGAMKSETVRLTFPTPVPFFPYLEPAHGAETGGEHTMIVWLVSEHERAPRLRRTATGQAPRWAWAWQSGLAYEKGSDAVATAVGPLAKLVPRGVELHVQTFRDRRTNRDGWGDVLFPVVGGSLEEHGWLRTARAMLGDLQGGLHAGPLEPGELANEDSFRVQPSRGCGCELGLRGDTSRPTGEAPLACLALAGLAAAAIRRRPRAR